MIGPIRGITVSVGPHYAGLLRVTLPRNMRHLARCLVVTAPGDPAAEVARGVPGVEVFETDAFTRPDADGVRPRFNKGLAIEEGLDRLGREGWILSWDADILFPGEMDLGDPDPGLLYGARRRMLADPSAWHEGVRALDCPPPDPPDDGPIGFFQLFHAGSIRLRGQRPWFDVSFAHAGGGDAHFMFLWPRAEWRVLPIDVLHLGEKDCNWFGADPEGRDLMSAYVHRLGWRRFLSRHDPSACLRVGEIVERVRVPGYAPSAFQLPGRGRRGTRPR